MSEYQYRKSPTELESAYQQVFNGDAQSNLVLADILSLLGLFNNAPATIVPECIAVANTIVSRLGCITSESGVNAYVQAITNAGAENRLKERRHDY